MNSDEYATQIEQFRTKVYQNFNKRADGMMDLLDAICSQTRAKSVVELSLESAFRGSYSAVFKALASYKPGDDELAKLAGPVLQRRSNATFRN